MFRSPTTDLLALLVILLVVFGPKRLPALGRQLGHGLRAFKDSIVNASGDRAAVARREIAPASSADRAATARGDGALGTGQG
ncbi:MAG: twin-arginine translocase TatA/TatE family subunit [Solirubrobacteraceae bacterium]